MLRSGEDASRDWMHINRQEARSFGIHKEAQISRQFLDAKTRRIIESGAAARLVLADVKDDYLVCNLPNDPTPNAPEQFLVAKQDHHRCSRTSKTSLGVVVNYTYATGPDAYNKVRTADDGENVEEEVITPPWCPGDMVFAIPADTGVEDESNVAVLMLDVGTSRQWTLKDES